MIVALSDEAVAQGIRLGMTLTQARALDADVEHAEHAPQRDHRALEAMARWLMRFTPVVAMDMGEEEAAPKSKSRRAPAARKPSHCIFLDITGCERLFQGLDRVVEQVIVAMRSFGIRARVAVAPTPGAAWALAAGAGRDGMCVSCEQLEASLAPLPPDALRLGDDVCVALHHLGLTTIGQIRQLPRSALPARFGDDLLRRIGQALGTIAEPLVPLQHRWPIEARMDFDGVVSSLEAIWIVFRELTDRLIVQLIRRGQGVRRMEIQLLRPYAPPIRQNILLSHPSRDANNLLNLFRCAMEDQMQAAQKTSARQLQRGSPVLLDDGYSGLHLLCTVCEPLGDEQITLLGQDEYASQLHLDRLLERLRARLGEEVVAQARLVESHLPEKRWEAQIDAATMGQRDASSSGRSSSRASSKRKAEVYPAVVSASAEASQLLPRPLHLLPMPVELRVTVSPSHDIDGRPISFTHDQQVHRVVHAIGPERVAGQWWTGHEKTRDYFEVESPTGQRFWIFRVTQSRRWFLHGMFD